MNSFGQVPPISSRIVVGVSPGPPASISEGTFNTWIEADGVYYTVGNGAVDFLKIDKPMEDSSSNKFLKKDKKIHLQRSKYFLGSCSMPHCPPSCLDVIRPSFMNASTLHKLSTPYIGTEHVPVSGPLEILLILFMES